MQSKVLSFSVKFIDIFSLTSQLEVSNSKNDF